VRAKSADTSVSTRRGPAPTVIGCVEWAWLHDARMLPVDTCERDSLSLSLSLSFYA